MRSIVVLTLLLASIVRAAPATQSNRSVDQLITQLGSDDYHVRQTAADQLVEQGEAVRPDIQKMAADPTDAERRNLAAGILTRLDRVSRQGPTPITLHVHEADAQTVLGELASQAKVAMRFSPSLLHAGRLPALTMDSDHQPFWLAVAELCRLTQTHVRSLESTAGIELTSGANTEPLAGPLCQAGPFVIAVVSSSRDRQVHYGDPAPAPIANDNMEFALYTDPRARPIDVPIPTLVEAIDETGRSVLPTPARPHVGNASLHGRWMRSFTCELTIAADAHTLKRLHGTIDATFAVESKSATIPDLQAGLHHPIQIGEASLEVTACKFSGRDGSYTFSFSRDTPGPFSLHGLRLIDASKNVIYEGKGSTVLSAAGAFVMSGAFSRTDVIKMPVSLVWTVATRTETVHEPFDFEELPLP